MKKVLLVFGLFLISWRLLAFTPGNIDEKLIHSFQSRFPEAKEVVWSEYPQYLQVSFMEGKIQSRVVYLRDGTLIRSIRYYRESQLPFNIRESIHRSYPSKSIYGVTEVSTIMEPGRYKMEYVIQLEDHRQWVTVKLNQQGEIKEEDRFQKAR